MNADDFYEYFKDALHYLGVAWGDKADVAVYLDGSKLVFEYCGKTASITLIQQGSAKT
jgi:hypothetical protein